MLIEYHNMFSQENNKKLNLVGNDICLISPSYSFQALYVDVRTLSHLCFSMFFYSVPMLEILMQYSLSSVLYGTLDHSVIAKNII